MPFYNATAFFGNPLSKKKRDLCLSFCGVGRDRTGDTRIFSPLLYRLSYRTIFSINLPLRNYLRSLRLGLQI